MTALMDYHSMPRDPAGQALFLYNGLEPTRVTRMQRYFSPADEVGQPKASDVDDNEGIADGVEVPVSPASATAEAGSMAPAIANVSRVLPGIPSMPKLNLIPPPLKCCRKHASLPQHPGCCLLHLRTILKKRRHFKNRQHPNRQWQWTPHP